MILTDAGISCVVFYGDWDPAFVWKDENHFPVLHLDRERALQAWKVTLDRDYLILSDDYVWEKDGKLHIEGEKETGGTVPRPVRIRSIRSEMARTSEARACI